MVGIYKNELEKKYYEKHSRIVKEKMELKKILSKENFSIIKI